MVSIQSLTNVLFGPSFGDSPAEEDLFPYRVILGLGGVLMLVFGLIYQLTSASAYDPVIVRLLMAGLYLASLGISYFSAWIRVHLPQIFRGVLYLTMGYLTWLVAANQFAPPYALGMLFAVPSAGVVFSIGLWREGPIRIFLGLATAVPVAAAIFAGSESDLSVLFVLSAVAFAGVFYLTIRWKIQTQMNLKRTKERYRRLCNSAPEGVLVHRDGEILLANDAAAELLHVSSRDELIGRSVYDYVAETDRESARERIEAILTRGERTEFEDRLARRADGEVFEAEVNARPVSLHGGTGIQVIFRDVTEQRQTLRALEESRALLRRTEEVASIGGWELDLEEGVVRGTDQLNRLVGLAPDEDFSLERAFEFYPPSVREQVRKKLDQCIEERIPVELEVPLITVEGKERWVHLWGEPDDSNGKVERVTGVLQDVTLRHQAESDLRRAVNFYEQVLKQLPVNLAVFDTEARYEYVNPSGISDPEQREWVIGHTNEEYFRTRGMDPEQGRRRDENIREVARTGSKNRFEETLETPSGPRHFIRAHVPITDVDGKVAHVAGFGIDITERKRQEVELRQAKEQAEESSRLKSAFLANMSHEIRTPLTSILGFADIVHERAPDSLESFVKPIQSASNRLLHTLNSVLDLARIESGTLELHFERIDLVNLCRDVVETMRFKAEDKDLSLELDLPGRPVDARTDKGAVERVLINLVDNAIKFTGEGRITVRLKATSEEFMMQVIDTGQGIAEEEQARLFEAFRQESSGLNRMHEGTGLGLTIVSELTHLLGGSVDLESERGKGTTVRVRVPRRLEHLKAEADKLPETDTTDLPSDVDVLTLDDDPMVGILISRMVPPTWNVDAVTEIDRVFDRLDKQSYDVILLDISLGGDRTGVDVMEEIRERFENRTTPIVAITAYAMPGDQQSLLDQGFDAYLAKPFKKAGLREMFDTALWDESAV